MITCKKGKLIHLLIYSFVLTFNIDNIWKHWARYGSSYFYSAATWMLLTHNQLNLRIHSKTIPKRISSFYVYLFKMTQSSLKNVFDQQVEGNYTDINNIVNFIRRHNTQRTTIISGHCKRIWPEKYICLSAKYAPYTPQSLNLIESLSNKCHQTKSTKSYPVLQNLCVSSFLHQ